MQGDNARVKPTRLGRAASAALGAVAGVFGGSEAAQADEPDAAPGTPPAAGAGRNPASARRARQAAARPASRRRRPVPARSRRSPPACGRSGPSVPPTSTATGPASRARSAGLDLEPHPARMRAHAPASGQFVQDRRRLLGQRRSGWAAARPPPRPRRAGGRGRATSTRTDSGAPEPLRMMIVTISVTTRRRSASSRPSRSWTKLVQRHPGSAGRMQVTAQQEIGLHRRAADNLSRIAPLRHDSGTRGSPRRVEHGAARLPPGASHRSGQRARPGGLAVEQPDAHGEDMVEAAVARGPRPPARPPGTRRCRRRRGPRCACARRRSSWPSGRSPCTSRHPAARRPAWPRPRGRSRSPARARAGRMPSPSTTASRRPLTRA